MQRGVGFRREFTVCDQVIDIFLDCRREPLGIGCGEPAGGLSEHHGCDRITDPLHAGAQRHVRFPAFPIIEGQRCLAVLFVFVVRGLLTVKMCPETDRDASDDKRGEDTKQGRTFSRRCFHGTWGI